jgi:hypothetical protein
MTIAPGPALSRVGGFIDRGARRSRFYEKGTKEALFRFLGRLAPGQHQAAEQTARKQVGGREDHAAMISACKTGHVTPNEPSATG